MALEHTPICDFGWSAPDFALKGTDGKIHSLQDVKGENGTLIMFICNHCPYVKAIITRLVDDVKKLQSQGIGVVAIMSNDTEAYPADSYENMQAFAAGHGFTFPYVIDEDQTIAKAYDAVCTPDFFGFNKDLGLQYRGRFDTAGRNAPGADNRHELLEAMQQVAKTGQGPKDQIPSMGCSIKWHQQAA